MEGAAKKVRRIPEVLVVPPAQLLKSKPGSQQIPLQQSPQPAFHFPQQAKRNPPILTAASPQMQQFYQQQQQQQIQQQPQPQPRLNQQQLHHLQTIRRQPHLQPIPKKALDELQVVELDPSSASQVAPWMLPAAINMPLHGVSPSFSVLGSSSPATPSPSNAPAPVRRVGAKRVAGPDDWRLANSPPSLNSPGAGAGPNVSFLSTPPPPPAAPVPGFVVSPASFSGPINISAANLQSRAPSARSSEPARAASIEKRKLKLKQVTAAYQSEYQEACQRLIALQREWREECEPKLSQETYILV